MVASTRRSYASANHLQIGPWRFDLGARELRHGEVVRRVSPKAAEVLRLLAEAGGAVVSRHHLLDQAWPGVLVCEEVLTHAIAELRRALEDDRKHPRYIETVHKAGYRLIQDVEVNDSVSAEGRSCVPASGPAHGLSLDAYCALLTGRSRFTRGGRQNMAAAIDAYRAAGEMAPQSALVKADLAAILTFMHLYYDRNAGHMARAAEAAESALRIDPHLTKANAALGLAQGTYGHKTKAVNSFTRALHCRGDEFCAHYLSGRYMFAAGDMRSASALLERASQINPDDFHSLVIAAKAFRQIGDGASAARAVRIAQLRIDQHLQADPDDVRALCGKAFCLVELGDVEGGLEIAAGAAPSTDPLYYYCAAVFARAGEVTHALDALEATVDSGWAHPAWLRADPDLTPLRREGRYRRLEAALGGAPDG